MKAPINPPNTQLVDSSGRIVPEWYRYLVKTKAISDAVGEAGVLTYGDASTAFANSRQLEVEPGELVSQPSAGTLTLGLADAGAADEYGSAAQTIAITTDAKGRVIEVQVFDLNTDNVEEGASNLYFTPARAREALSGGDGIDYDSASGVIAFDPLTAGLSALPIYADNAAATAGGLAIGRMYRTATGQLMARY